MRLLIGIGNVDSRRCSQPVENLHVTQSLPSTQSRPRHLSNIVKFFSQDHYKNKKVMGSTTAKCIFDLLTAKNPVVKYPEPTSMSNTTSTAWFTPRQVTHWDEFKFETLEAIYGGELMDEARRSVNHLPPYPYIKPAVDCVVWDEDSTVHLLTKWNHSIVTAGLDAVEKFQHCEWVPWVQTTRDEEDSVADKTTKLRRPRSCSQDISYGRKRSSRRLRPDAGGSISSSRSTDTTNGSQQLTESFPKEYKTASKWKSSAVFEKYLVQETGQWKPNLSRKNDLMPIRQIYSYCVRHECRYGCILTTAEAFIFRIKPREARPGKCHCSLDTESIIKAVQALST